MTERDLKIDLVKLIATAMVVILHVIENTRGGVYTAILIFTRHLWHPFIFNCEWIPNV